MLKSVTEGRVTVLPHLYDGLTSKLANQNQEIVRHVFRNCWGPYIIDFMTEPGVQTLDMPGIEVSACCNMAAGQLSLEPFTTRNKKHSTHLFDHLCNLA